MSVIGSIIDDKYSVVSCLGEGGMGAVYLAEQKDLSRLVAIKILHSSFLSNEEQKIRFEREAKVLAGLEHKNIISGYRFGRLENGSLFMVMEYLEGKSIRQILNDADRLNWQRVLSIAIQMADALVLAHGKGVIHRDLKPQNIMILEKPIPDSVKILDFGLARLYTESSEPGEQRLTQTGALIGSVAYLSPEQCLGKKADQRSDIYALGCVLYECLVGRAPFEADNPVALLHLHVNVRAKPFPILSGDDKIPAQFEQIIFRMMAKNADDRFQSMSQVLDALILLRDGNDEALQLLLPGGARSSIATGLLKGSHIKAILFIVVVASLVFALYLIAVKKVISPSFNNNNQENVGVDERSAANARKIANQALEQKSAGNLHSAVLLARKSINYLATSPKKEASAAIYRGEAGTLAILSEVLKGQHQESSSGIIDLVRSIQTKLRSSEQITHPERAAAFVDLARISFCFNLSVNAFQYYDIAMDHLRTDMQFNKALEVEGEMRETLFDDKNIPAVYWMKIDVKRGWLLTKLKRRAEARSLAYQIEKDIAAKTEPNTFARIELLADNANLWKLLRNYPNAVSDCTTAESMALKLINSEENSRGRFEHGMIRFTSMGESLSLSRIVEIGCELAQIYDSEDRFDLAAAQYKKVQHFADMNKLDHSSPGYVRLQVEFSDFRKLISNAKKKPQ